MERELCAHHHPFRLRRGDTRHVSDRKAGGGSFERQEIDLQRQAQRAEKRKATPEAEVFPRLAVFESDREYTRFADDQPLEEEITFRIDIYARENLLYPINAALHSTVRRNGYQRYGQVQDDYLQDMDIYVKSATYTIKDQLPFPWE